MPPTNGSEPRIVSIRPVTVCSTLGTIVPTIEVTMFRICAIGPWTTAGSIGRIDCTMPNA